jgi:hypothetical protein
MTGLACKKCGSRDTVACRARDLVRKTGDRSFFTASCGYVLDPTVVFGLLRALAEAARACFDYLGWREKNNPPLVVYRACGFWERLSAPDGGAC